MKKLIPMIAGVACAITAFAAQKTPLTVSDFEGLTPDESLSMEGTTWSKAETDEAPIVKAYAVSDTKYTYGDQDTLTANPVGSNYLAIETSAGPVYRNANDGETRSIADADLYIDTLVKFTVTDAETTPEADADAKLALWLQDAGTTTNLMLRCGDHNAETKVLGKKTVTLNAGTIELNDTTWYRLTVRALKSAATDDTGVAIAAFKIFLNGNELADTDGATEFLACIAGTTLTAVGFKGSGGVDDVAFADELGAPSFAIPPVTKLTITWNPEIVTALKINGVAADASAGTVEVEPVEGFVTVSGIECSGDYVAVDQKFTADSKSFEVAYVTSGVVADGKKYATLQYALADGTSAITLKTAATIADLENYIQVGGEKAVDMSIDLAGNTITATDLAVPVLFYVTEGSTLSIVDSIGGGVITVSAAADNEQFSGLVQDDGTVTIGSATDKGVTVDGLLTASGSNTTLNSGKFLASANGALADMVTIPEGYELAKDGDYLVVKAKEGPEPEPTYTVTINKADNTTVSEIMSNDVVVAAITTAKEGDVIKVTFAAAEDYELDGEATVTKTVGTAAVTIDGPTATAIEYVTVAAPVTIDNGSYTVEPNGAKVRKGTEVTVTVTPAAEIEVESITINGEAITESEGVYAKTFTANENLEFTVVITKVTPPPAQDLPGAEDLPIADKAAYNEWAAATGVTADDTDKANALAAAYLLGVTGTETPVAAIAAAEAKVTDLVKDIDLTALAAGKEALTAVTAKLPSGLQAVLKPVEQTEIKTDAKLFRLVVEVIPANAK